MKLISSLVLIFTVLVICVPTTHQQILGYTYAAQNNWTPDCLLPNQSPISFVGATIDTSDIKSFIKIYDFASGSGKADVQMTNQQLSLNFHSNKGWLQWQAPNSDGNYVNFTSNNLQVHYPAEHQFDDQRVLEFQFRGQSDNAENGAVVIQFKVDDTAGENDFVQPFADAVKHNNVSFTMDIHGLFYDQIDRLLSPSVVTYTGSDTQPPCVKDFQWYIVKQAGLINSTQLSCFKPYFGSARTVQPTNGRNITQLGSLQVQKSATNLMVPFLAILALIFTLMFF